MTKIKRLKYFLKNPKMLIVLWGSKGFLNWIPDRQYLQLVYRIMMRKKLNIDSPATFNEKLQWLKLNDRNPAYTTYVDKYEVRTHVAEKIGENYLVPLLHVFDSVEQVDWDSLPHKFALKWSHGSGTNIICTDKDKLDIKSAQIKLEKWRGINWYWYGREWPYKDIKPRIVCEKFISDLDQVPDDYKVLCFNGKAKLIEVHLDRYGNHKQDYYDIEWNKTSISQEGTSSDSAKSRPPQLEKMIQLSELLAAPMRHVRIDWFIVRDQLYFGEITFYDASGFVPFDNETDDYLLGSWLDLKGTHECRSH